MTQDIQSAGPTFIPYFGYQDAAAALAWLTKAFGFEKTQEFLGPDGTVIHAEMRFGGGVIMLGTANDEESKQSSRHLPAGHGIYVYVDGIEAHYERAKSAGARSSIGPRIPSLGREGTVLLTWKGTSGALGRIDLRVE